jgi:hypothetical protein
MSNNSVRTTNLLPFVYQYNETNLMHFIFNLLRIMGLYMFRKLVVHPQEGLHKRHLIYWVRIMSVGCVTATVTLYARNIPNAVCVVPHEDEQVMLETCGGPLILNKLNKKCITLVSSHWYTTMHGQQHIKFTICVWRQKTILMLVASE